MSAKENERLKSELEDARFEIEALKSGCKLLTQHYELPWRVYVEHACEAHRVSIRENHKLNERVSRMTEELERGRALLERLRNG